MEALQEPRVQVSHPPTYLLNHSSARRSPLGGKHTGFLSNRCSKSLFLPTETFSFALAEGESTNACGRREGNYRLPDCTSAAIPLYTKRMYAISPLAAGMNRPTGNTSKCGQTEAICKDVGASKSECSAFSRCSMPTVQLCARSSTHSMNLKP